MTALFLAFCLLVSFPGKATASAPAVENVPPLRAEETSSYCEDFAQRQVQLADRLLQNANYTRALKVLNSTVENCDRELVREKIFEVMRAWYNAISGQSAAALQQYLNTLSNQPYLSSSQRSQLKQPIEADVQSLIRQEFEGENYNAAYDLCQAFSKYASEDFELEYYCGSSADELGASGVAMNSYAWLLDNWNSDQSLTTWDTLADRLEQLYLLNGRFRAGYELARQMAERNPSPKTILSSLLSARGNFLSPLLRIGSTFYGQEPSEAALRHVDNEMQRVNFPSYVQAFYLISADGSVERGMYGSEANQPSASLLERVSGTVSLLQSPESNLAWLVSPVDSRFLVLEFGVATTAEENVRLENIHENVENDQQWSQLYQLEFTETYPASGSAIGTILSGSLLSSGNFGAYDRIFDDSPVLTYYCIQNDGEGIEESFNFSRSRLSYGEDEWERTSTTPALYHHTVQFEGESVREVVWPNFVDDSWTGIVRIGFTQS
jgi:hypothetical protein